jgi:hypothetical protein
MSAKGGTALAFMVHFIKAIGLCALLGLAILAAVMLWIRTVK